MIISNSHYNLCNIGFIFTNSILDHAMRKDTTHTGFELLIDNWGTMEEWGRSDGGRTHRPRVKDLASFCRQIDNYRAASYVNHEILGGSTIFLSVYTIFLG